MKERITKEEWSKLWIAKLNGWTVSVGADQHVLGWLIIFPASDLEGSIVHLSDHELLMFKKIGLILENILVKTFNSEWFNYIQAGNVIKKTHIHLIPRYSSSRSFDGHEFIDKAWGHPVEYLPLEALPEKEVVFEIVSELRKAIANQDLSEFEVEIFDN